MKICPICDTELGAGNFCPVCKRIRPAPVVLPDGVYLNKAHSSPDVNCEFHGHDRAFTFLNRRHPEGEKDCSYHNDPDAHGSGKGPAGHGSGKDTSMHGQWKDGTFRKPHMADLRTGKIGELLRENVRQRKEETAGRAGSADDGLNTLWDLLRGRF